VAVRVRDLEVVFGAKAVLITCSTSCAARSGVIESFRPGKSVLARTILGLLPSEAASSKYSAEISMTFGRVSAEPSNSVAA
jgi:ABC-type microcin C transport system duplicated ATPase subunit YejF